MSTDKTIKLIFGAVDRTAGAFTGVNQRLTSMAAPVASVTKKFLLLEAAITAVGVALAAKAFSESAKFEGALLDLQKVLGESEGSASQFTGTVDDLSVRFGVASDRVLQGAANFKQAGFTIKESFDLQKVALEAASVSELDAVGASELLVSTLKGFKLPASEAGRVIDVVNATSNKYATNFRELLTGMAGFSPIAEKMNLSIEETTGVLVPMIEVFRSGSEAAIAGKTGFGKLVSNQKPVIEALKKLGVSQRDVNGKLRDGREILLDVAKAFTTVEKSEKLKIATDLVGLNQAGRMLEVFDSQKKILQVTNDANKAAGSRLKETEIALSSAEKKADSAKVAFNNMARSLGDNFLPEIKGVIGSVTEIEIALKNVTESGGFEPLFNIIRPQIEEWKDLLTGIAAALPEAFEALDWTPITEALERVTGSFDGMFDGLDLTKPEDLAALINEIIDIGGTLIDTTRGIAEVLAKVAGAAVDVVKWFSDLEPSTQKLVGVLGGVSIAFTALAPALAATATAASLLTPKFATLAGAKGVGLLTGALGKAGLVGAVGVASFELGKLLTFATDKIGEFFSGTEGWTWGGALGDLIYGDATLSQPADPALWQGRQRTRPAQAAAPDEEADIHDQRMSFLDTETEGQIKYIKFIQKRTGAEKDLKDAVNETTAAETTALDITKDRLAVAEDDAQRMATHIEKMGELDNALAQIESHERVQTLELGVKVNMAQLDAATKQFEGSMELIGKGVQSTENTVLGLSTLYAQQGNASAAGAGIKNVLDQEQKTRTEGFRLQHELLQVEIDLNKERLAQMRDGQPQIVVKADGMEPALQSVIYSMIENIQLEGTLQGVNQLLNMPVPAT